MSGPVAGSAVIFAYDGISRRTKITEFTNGTMTSKKLYFWLGGSIVCERDGLQTGFPITKQYFGQGEVRGATKLYYTFDHLGSIRELVDSAGTVQAEYSYSTYGERTKVSGNLDSDWGYAGLWHHQASGLDLATYRAYDAANKRWISRDPLGEGVDYNLYRYCGNSPINGTDSEGLAPFSGTLTVYAWGLGGRVQAVNVNINGNYDPHSGRVTAELGTQNLLPASARIKTTVSIQQLSSGDSGSFTIDEDDDSPVPSTKKKKKKCSARETQIDTYHRGQRTKRRYVAKMDPASFVRIRIDVVVDPIPILGGNPFSFGGQSVGVPFTQGSNTFILDGFHNRDNIVDIHDI